MARETSLLSCHLCHMMLMELYKLCRKYIYVAYCNLQNPYLLFNESAFPAPHTLSLSISVYFHDSSVPTPPRLLTTAGNTASSTVGLNWLPPLHPNGAIHYEIEYEPAVTPGDPVNAGNSNTSYFTLTLPNEFLTYTVRVAAVNSKGQTRSSDLPLSCPGMNRERGTLATQQQLLQLCTDVLVTCLWNSICTITSFMLCADK